MEALKIIRSEHRHLVAILGALQGLVRDLEARGRMPDPELIESMLDYVDSFLNRFHHPKETAHLFAALVQRRPDMKPVLDDLNGQHDQVDDELAAMRAAWETLKAAGPSGLEAFRDAVLRYTRFEYDHMGLEEREVLPAATEALTADDWQAIDATFADHGDPLFGDSPRADYRKMLRHIVETLPAPHGLGPPLER